MLGTAIPSPPALGIGEMPDTKTIDQAPAKKQDSPGKKKEEDSKKSTTSPKKAGLGAMGGDIAKFGEEVAQRIDRIVKKKTFELWGDPWTMQGIPIVFPSPASGFNLGLRVQLQNIRRQDPHEAEIIGQVLSSDRGRQKHLFLVDFPWAFKNRMRIGGYFAYDRDISLRYFGIGNSNPYDQALVDANDPQYQNIRAAPTLSFQLFGYFTRQFRGGPIFTFRWTDISFPTGSLLDQQQPVGVGGGRTHSFGLALIYDTLDFEPYPSRGSYHELFFNLYDPAITGSDYRFTRTTYTFRKYVSLHRRLIFAHRTVLEYLGGDVPFFEMGNIGGTFSTQGIGGDRIARGYEPNRFMDKLRLFLGFELRWDPVFVNFLRQDMTIGFVPFIDIGRVWSDRFPTEFDRWHASVGWGVRFIWSSRLILRFDTAFTPGRISIVANIGSSF